MLRNHAEIRLFPVIMSYDTRYSPAQMTSYGDVTDLVCSGVVVVVDDDDVADEKEKKKKK